MMIRSFRRLFSNVKTFNNLEAMNQYLGKNKFSHTVVYFRANWNPNCTITDQHFNDLAKETAGVQFIKVDSDEAPKIAKHYGVRAEPQFVFCLFGDEVIRQTGPNYKGLKSKLQKMDELVTDPDLNNISDKWKPYGARFEAYYENNLKQKYTKFTNLF